MTTFTPNRHPQPLVAAYLADLDRALIGAHPQERADTLAAVREHLDAALDEDHDKEAALAVLADLGPVERIAASATPAAERPVPKVDTDWTARALLTCALVALAIVWAVPWVAAPVAIGTLIMASVQVRRGSRRSGTIYASIVLSVVTLLVAAVMALVLLPVETHIINDDVQTAWPYDR